MTTVAAARDAYLVKNGFSTTAYEDRWVHVKILGIPIVFPNVPSRRRAIRFHDIHHVVTRYDTTLRGEAEIAAWEIAATFPDRGREFFAAWVLNTSAFGVGLAIAPRRVYRAFVRGRHCTSLYRRGWSEELLARDVETLRRELGLDRPHRATWRDRLVFAALAGALALPPAVLGLLVWLALR
jgi:ubiquinone biosynthesis protein COQ4